MKLFQLFKRYIVLIILSVLIIGGVAHYFIFSFFMHRSTDNILYEYKQYIENYVQLNDTLIASSLSVLQPPRVEERLIDNPSAYPEMLKDTLLYSESTGEFMPYRQLYFTVSYKNYSHLVNINQPTVESDDLFYAVFTSLVTFIILFIAFSYLVGNYIQHKLWTPFYKLLNTVQAYDLHKTNQLHLEKSGITEFDELGDVINRMVAKIHADYINLKTFTEDASHEMQTPLSIIKSKLDLLIQSETNEENIKAILAMSTAATRLSKLNKSLLLLAKINNNQFREVEQVNFTLIIKTYLEDLSELIEAKNIKVQIVSDDLLVEMNRSLADIVVSNLLSNAIRYNEENGKIDIQISKNELRLSNTSKPIDKSINLFNRFGKQKGGTGDSTGLGLNIVKSICDTSNLLIEYEYSNGYFCIIIKKVQI